MSVLGNPLLFGGGNSTPFACGYAWHTMSGTTYRLVCGPNSAWLTAYAADNECFSFADGVFTCLKAGTYTVHYFGRGGYNSSGTSISMYYQVLHNSTVVASATNVANAGVCNSVTVTLAVGDTISAQTRNASGNTAHDFGYIIVPA